MATLLTSNWTPVQSANLPVVEETDWRETNDITGFTDSAQVRTIVPKLNEPGSFQLGLLYFDAQDDLVIPARNSRVVVEFLQLIDVEGNPAIGVTARKALVRAGADITLKGEEVITGEIIGKFAQEIGVRIVSSQSEPAGATRVIVIARFS